MMMNLKGFGRKCNGLILRNYAGIRLKGLRKTTNIFVRIDGHRGWELNL
jgi:hypothetical protein